LVSGRPEQLLLISTGNIGNTELESLLRKNISRIVAVLETNRFVEIGRHQLTIHGDGVSQ
jgi:predicted nuclease of predicted toxin-antitoxin system